MRIATTTRVTTGVVLGIAGIVGIASRHDDQPARETSVELTPSPESEPETASSTTILEPPPPPEAPFYSSLFVVGRTWTLPCTFEGRPSGTQRCRVDSVEVTAQGTSARIGCWYLDEGEVPDPAVNTYLMTPTGLYKAEKRPSTHAPPMFTSHPVAKSLPKGWGQAEPSEPGWANAIVHHHDAWCTVDDFQSLDTSAAYVECISRKGIVGLAHVSLGNRTQRCGDVPKVR